MRKSFFVSFLTRCTRRSTRASRVKHLTLMIISGELHPRLKHDEIIDHDYHCSDNKKADLTWEWYARHENSLIRDLFVGQLKSTLKCTTCGNTSVTFDPFWDLSVPLPSSSRCKLEACLDLFIREEVLDGDEMPTCSKCKTRRKCTKSFTIQRFPKYLVIRKSPLSTPPKHQHYVYIYCSCRS